MKKTKYERINPEIEALKGVKDPEEAMKGIKIRVKVLRPEAHIIMEL